MTYSGISTSSTPGGLNAHWSMDGIAAFSAVRAAADAGA